jgi:uncharacterized protein (TIGR02231 family)
MKITTLSLVFFATMVSFLGISTYARAEQKKEIVPASKIDRVMVYPDRALVTRTARCTVQEPGIYEILFNNMPVLLMDDSVRAKTAGTDVKILDVEVRALYLERSPEKIVQEEQKKLEQLEDEKRGVENSIAVLKSAAEYLKGVSESFLGVPVHSDKKAGERRLGMRYKDRLTVNDYDRMLTYLNARNEDNRAALQREEKKLRVVEKKIALARTRLAKIQGSPEGLPRKKFIKVTAETQKAGSFDIEISYINHKISWKPGYDIRVFPEEKKTEFVGYGVVAQSSGEDWVSSWISFSTAQPAVRGYLPELVPIYATLASKIQYRPGGKSKMPYASQQQMNKAILDNIEQGEAAGKHTGDSLMMDSAAERGVSRQAGSLVFQVPKRADIPSDGSAHRTAISRQTFPVKFEYISTPKISPYAYLQAVGTNTLSAPILRGDLNIFMGNDFVGSSYTDNILPGEDFELVLSVNENIRVTRSLEEKEEKEAGFLGGTKKISYRFLVKIENYSGADIVMNVFDQIPVSRTSEIEIKDVVFSHTPQKKDVKGICKWQFAMKPKETVNLTFSFTVSVPKDKEAAFFRTKLSPGVYLDRLSTGAADEYEESEYKRQEKAPALRMKQ